MKYLLIPFIVLACGVAYPATVTLTPGQVDSICGTPPNPEPPPTPPPEPPAPEPPQQCENGKLQASVTDWQSIFAEPFPRPRYKNAINKVVPAKGYLAIRFNTRYYIDDGKLSLLEQPQSPGIRTGSISQCPGDFNVPSSCRYTWGLGGGLKWATNNKFGACKLNPNTTYYFNITFTDGSNSATSTCPGAPCYINLQHTNF